MPPFPDRRQGRMGPSAPPLREGDKGSMGAAAAGAAPTQRVFPELGQDARLDLQPDGFG